MDRINEPSQPKRFPLLDGLRALSILWLVGFHSLWYLGFFIPQPQFLSLMRSSPITSLILNGHMGVDVFFVLSGFLIMNVLLHGWRVRRSDFLLSFYRRRAFRIFPAYLVAMLLYVLHISWIPYGSADRIWANFLMVNNYLPISQQAMSWSWSLAIEEQFYLLLPCLLIFARGPGRKFLLTLSALFVLAFLIRAAVVLYHGPWTRVPIHVAFDAPLFYRFFDTVYGRTHMRFGALVAGVLARLLLDEKRVTDWIHGGPMRARCFLGLSTLAAAGVILGESLAPAIAVHSIRAIDTVLILDRYLFATGLACLILYWISEPGRPSLGRALLSRPEWRRWAEWSYSAYLLNPLFMVTLGILFQSRLQNLDPLFLSLYVFLCFALTFAAASVLYVLIERPFQELGKKLGST